MGGLQPGDCSLDAEGETGKIGDPQAAQGQSALLGDGIHLQATDGDTAECKLVEPGREVEVEAGKAGGEGGGEVAALLRRQGGGVGVDVEVVRRQSGGETGAALIPPRDIAGEAAGVEAQLEAGEGQSVAVAVQPAGERGAAQPVAGNAGAVDFEAVEQHAQIVGTGCEAEVGGRRGAGGADGDGPGQSQLRSARPEGAGMFQREHAAGQPRPQRRLPQLAPAQPERVHGEVESDRQPGRQGAGGGKQGG